jgi:hypothetical protein
MGSKEKIQIIGNYHFTHSKKGNTTVLPQSGIVCCKRPKKYMFLRGKNKKIYMFTTMLYIS